MSTETTTDAAHAGLGSIVFKLGTILSGIALPSMADLEGWARLFSYLAAGAYGVYSFYDLHQRRKRDAARRAAGQDTNRGAL